MNITGDDNGFTAQWLDPTEHIDAYTSGSTGAPKHIRLSKADMRASAEATCRFFGIDSASTMLSPLSTDYIAGKMMVVRAIVSGASLRIVKPTAEVMPTWDDDTRFDFVAVVPRQLEAITDHLDRFRHILIGGAPLAPEAEERIASLHPSAWIGYGMTETCSHVALRRLGTPHYKAMEGISFATDARGCLIVDAQHMSIGRITTNDVVRLHTPTTFEWLGRHDNVINSGGVKIHPETDERLLSQVLPPECRFYISSRQSPQWGREAVLVVIDPSPLDDAELLEACRRVLPRHHVPKAVVHDPAPRYTASGKLIRKQAGDA